MAPIAAAALMEMKQGLDDITAKLRPLINEIKAGNMPTKNGISYLEVKHLLLFSYCETLVFYILCRAEGRNIKDHPLWLRLAEIKFILEKIRPIDKKLEYQIEKLLRAGQSTAADATGEGAGKEDPLSYKPNPDLLVSKLDQMAEDGGGVYRPPMIAPAAMEEEGTGRDRRSKLRAEKDMHRRAARSSFIKELANEVEGRPEEVREALGTESKEMLRDIARLEKRAEQEEELFARVPLNREERRKVKNLKKGRSGLLGMLDDFEDDVVGLTNMDEAPQQQSDWPSSGKASKRRTLSQMANEAGSYPKRSKHNDKDAPEEVGEGSRKHKGKKSRR
ncbi:hypothetical protein M758_4G013400 [Ceratodon purpureus]|nr:hypothetical protein M758_4G013400 [Ceratodon purpureus]